MRIGLVGGIGPAATIAYYRELVRLHAAAGRDLPLTIVNAEVRAMTVNLAADRRSEQAGIFASLVDRLRDGGCEIAALTSMGGHFCIGELRERSSLPSSARSTPSRRTLRNAATGGWASSARGR